MSSLGLVILDSDTSESNFSVAYLNQNFGVVGTRTMSEVDLVNELKPDKHTVLLNAGLDKSTGKIIPTCGAFSRFQTRNGVSPRVILAEHRTQSGRLLGYKIINKLAQVSDIRASYMFSLCEAAKKLGVSYVQNGIYSVKDNIPRISCYPNSHFIKLVNKPRKQATLVNQVNKTVNKENLRKKDKYTPKQLKELESAKSNGVNPLIIANPRLTPEMMRVIWVSKRNGMASEYFANPKFSVEAMKFFADRLANKKMFHDCKILFNPSYTVEQLTEVYLGIYSGVDVSQYADETIPSESMYVKRLQLEESKWSDSSLDIKSNSKSENDCVASFLKRGMKHGR